MSNTDTQKTHDASSAANGRVGSSDSSASDTPRTDARCADSQELKTMAMRFAWMCDHGRRLEREINGLREALTQARSDIVRLRDAPLSLERVIAQGSIERIDAAMLFPNTELTDAHKNAP